MASAARKAWNEAMKATAGATALPPSLQQRQRKRRSDRNKKQERRQKARKVQIGGDADSDEFRTALWIDALEGVDPSAAAVDDDEEYDELDDLEDRKKKATKKRRRDKVGVLPKRFLPRSLGTILMEEVSYGPQDSVAQVFLAAQAKVPPSQQLPRRRFCPVTGLPGKYVDPKSGVPFASMKALEQIRERPPPWMTLGGSAAYLEACKAIEDDA